MKKIFVHEEYCMNCRLCEVHCIVQNSKTRNIIKAYKGEYPKALPRVLVEEQGYLSFALQCRHCEDAPCLEACITGAMHRDPGSGAVSSPTRSDALAAGCGHIVPEAARRRLADAVDAFCATIGFDLLQTRRVFQAAREHGLPVKLHAEQLSNMHGAALAAEFGALAADHLEHVDEAGVAAMAQAGTVAVMLPGAYYFLRDTHLPPIELFRRHGVPMAVATDCNPGSSPTTHLPLMMNMACTLFRMTPEETLAGVTRNAAAALGMGATHGALRAGYAADLAIWDIDRPAELSYWLGGNPCAAVLRAGRWRGKAL